MRRVQWGGQEEHETSDAGLVVYSAVYRGVDLRTNSLHTILRLCDFR